jgi:hypothetical protein
LEKVEGDPPVDIQGGDFAVHKGAGWEPFAGTGDMRELVCEEVAPPRPERHVGRIPAGKAAVAVDLDLIEPVLSFRQLVDQSSRTSAR